MLLDDLDRFLTVAGRDSEPEMAGMVGTLDLCPELGRRGVGEPPTQEGFARRMSAHEPWTLGGIGLGVVKDAGVH